MVYRNIFDGCLQRRLLILKIGRRLIFAQTLREKGIHLEMNEGKKPLLALFYCQNVPGSGEEERQSLEIKYGRSLRLFPIPCSGRLELHSLRPARSTRL